MDPPLRVREDWWVFEKSAPVGRLTHPLSLEGKGCANESRVKLAFKLPSAANLLHEKKGLGKEVEPSLMVKKDGLILEKNLRVRKDG